MTINDPNRYAFPVNEYDKDNISKRIKLWNGDSSNVSTIDSVFYKDGLIEMVISPKDSSREDYVVYFNDEITPASTYDIIMNHIIKGAENNIIVAD